MSSQETGKMFKIMDIKRIFYQRQCWGWDQLIRDPRVKKRVWSKLYPFHLGWMKPGPSPWVQDHENTFLDSDSRWTTTISFRFGAMRKSVQLCHL